MKNQDISRKWEVFDAHQLSVNSSATPAFVLQDSESFNFTSRMLPCAVYDIRLTVSYNSPFFDLRNYTVIMNNYALIDEPIVDLNV